MNKAPTIIIAEAGVNHNGDIEIAKQLVDIADYSGADYVKFQTFKANKLVSKFAEKAEYQKKLTGEEESHYQMIKKLELSEEYHLDLINYCKDKRVNFLSSPFDCDSVEYLETLDIPLFKIPSGEITNLPYLELIGSKRRPIIFSTGMANLDEVKVALNILMKNGTAKEDITVLHCNTQYPTPIKDVNLNAMLTMKESLGVNVGYSDHTEGIEIPIAAVSMGAKVIEKHFTLDKTLAGPDHAASLEPNELKSMISFIRNVELSLGDGIKKPSPSEIKNIEIVRKSIFTVKKIKKGEIFSKENLCIKRPNTGLSPLMWNKIIGKRAKRDYNQDEVIK